VIDTQAIRSKILDLAMRGQLTEQLPEDGNAEELYLQIQEERQKLIKDGSIKKNKTYPEITNEDMLFNPPTNWKWIRFSNIITLQSGQDLKKDEYNSNNNGIPYLTGASNFNSNNKLMINRWTTCPKSTAKQGDILLSCKGTVGKIAILHEEIVHIARQFMAIRVYLCNKAFVMFFLESIIEHIKKASKGLIPGIERNDILSLSMPLPPIAEQNRIVQKIQQANTILDTIDELQAQYADNLTALKSKLIDAAIQGKLTEQLPEDGTAEELYKSVQKERKRQEDDGVIKKVELLPDVDSSNMPFSITSSWKWTLLGNMSYIVRGGSPRPIKQYITTQENGINWIKIGDVEKGGKYIYSTKERIIPEGESKSRRVYPGDFLLTNSMSFGRPYISKIEGCIHDGWLLIRNLNGFDSDYLYYLLSSTYLYNQFIVKASGSTVDNLNIDKVKSAIIPLPPLAEQKRIVQKLEEILPLCERIN